MTKFIWHMWYWQEIIAPKFLLRFYFSYICLFWKTCIHFYYIAFSNLFMWILKCLNLARNIFYLYNNGKSYEEHKGTSVIKVTSFNFFRTVLIRPCLPQNNFFIFHERRDLNLIKLSFFYCFFNYIFTFSSFMWEDITLGRISENFPSIC